MFYFWSDSGGDGGVAGRGGIVRVSSTARLEAYNGNKYTDGTDYENGKNQLEIFAQNGKLRSVYKLNAWWDYKENYNYEYFNKLFGETIADGVDSIKIANTYDEVDVFCVRKEQDCSKTTYINPITKNNQGIGSGAGYLETSNGTFKEITETP